MKVTTKKEAFYFTITLHSCRTQKAQREERVKSSQPIIKTYLG